MAVCIPAFVPTPFRRSAFPHFPQKRPCDCRAPEGGTPETKTASHAQKSGSTKRPNAGEQLTKDFAGHRKRWKSVACHVESLVRGCQRYLIEGLSNHTGYHESRVDESWLTVLLTSFAFPIARFKAWKATSSRCETAGVAQLD